MRKYAVGLALTVALVLVPWQSAWGQVSIGAHASYMSEIGTISAETAEGTWGLGGRLGIGVPVVGLRFLATGDVFFPDCDTEDCDFYAFTVNMLYSLPVPVMISPYFGAGIAAQSSSGPTSFLGEETDWGLNLMAGVSLSSGGTFEPFVELKYPLMKDFEDELIVSAGLAISTW